MKIAIQINEGPYQHQASDSAYQFAKAAIAKGHEIFRVFFYHDGVNNASAFTVPPQDDRNVINQWAELGIKNADGEPELVICIAAALRRGMLDESEAGKNGITGNNINPAFRISGLGQLIEAGIQAERLVVFGD
ncbi:MAG: sulfurtransferase complex subunit TusD [Candidatus Thioglobus sp.]|nr:sulfurtransferase complex subunit TusD [Candidatus Thioglobus sp.]